MEQGHYLRLAQEPDGSLLSRITNLRLRPEGQNLRLIDAQNGEKLLWTAEKDSALEAAARKAEEEAAERSRLERELATLRAELERMRTKG